MGRVLHFLLSSVFDVLVNFKAPVGNLLLSFISFDEYWSCLDYAIALPALEEFGGALIALVDDSDLFMHIGFLQCSTVHIVEVVVNKLGALGFDEVQVEQPLYVEIASDFFVLQVGSDRLFQLRQHGRTYFYGFMLYFFISSSLR